MKLAILFNFNMAFASVQDENCLVRQGYIPLLSLLEQYPAVKADFAFTGYSSLELAKNHPQVIEKVKNGMHSGRFDLCSYTYGHGHLPALPYASAEKQICRGLEVDEEIWGRKPKGFFPPDCGWDASQALTLKTAGIKWVVTHDNYLKKSCPAYYIYPSCEELDFYYPINVIGINNILMPTFFINEDYLLFAESDPVEKLIERLEYLEERRQEKEIIFLLSLDGEFMYILKYRDMGTWAQQDLNELFARLVDLPFIEFTNLDSYLATHSPEKKLFLRAPRVDFQKGSEKLNLMTEEARREITSAERALIIVEKRSADVDLSGVRELIARAWDSLLLAEASDARFTNASWTRYAYPTPKQITRAMESTLKARDTAREAFILLADFLSSLVTSGEYLP